MTIAAAYLVSDGVVLGADSSTTVQVTTPQGTGVVQLLDHSQKIFEIGKDSRLGICTWGAGSLGNISHRTIIAQLADNINEESTVKDVADQLVKLVELVAAKANIEFVGYYLGGWNPGTHEPACCHIGFKKGKGEVTPLQLGLCSFSGNASFFTRVFRGFDPGLQDALREKLKNSISAKWDGDFDGIFNKAFEEAVAPFITAGFQDLPIREAIDFIYSYLHITVKAVKFKYGPPSCGGPIEVGFISTDRRFRWVRHKPFYSAITEQEGEDDV